MDWLSILIAILVFVLPAIFESDKKKKKRKEAHLPHPVEDPDQMEIPWPAEEVRQEDDNRHTVQPVNPVPDEVPAPAEPEAEPVCVETPVFAEKQILQCVPDASAAAPTDQSPTVRNSGRKHRFNARDMVIYSEIMHPKYLEK